MELPRRSPRILGPRALRHIPLVVILSCGTSDLSVEPPPGESTLTQSGGTFTFGAVTLTVPPNAVSNDVTVQITTATDAPATANLVGDAVSITLSPVTTLQVPATLVIDYSTFVVSARIPASSLLLHRAENGQWVSLGGTNSAVDQTVTVQISSFSDFGVLGRRAQSVDAQSPLTQSAPVETAVSNPPSVLVLADDGNALPDIDVEFEVTSGGGSTTPSSVPTDASGIATATQWILGPAEGPNNVSATVADLTPVAFNATGTAIAPGPSDTIHFFSDWSTATGRTENAMRDGTKWPRTSANPETLRDQIVSASGLGFPSGMTNVLQVGYHGDQDGLARGGAVSVRPSDALWEVTGTQTLFHRFYFHNAIRDAIGWTLPAIAHPYQSNSTIGCSVTDFWQVKIGADTDGTWGWFVDIFSSTLYGDWTLNKDQTYMFEVALTRINASSYDVRVRIDGVDVTATLHGGGDSRQNTLAEDSPFTITDACIQSNLWVGNNDPGGWRQRPGDPNPLSPHNLADTGKNGPFPDQDFVYWGGIAIAVRSDASAWIGPYQAGRGW